MKLDKSALDELTRSVAFQQWPATQAMEQAGGGWEDIREQILHLAAQQLVWEMSQRLALLFETYGKAMERAELKFSTASDQGDYLSSSFQVNGRWAGSIGMLDGKKNKPSKLYPEFLAIDGGRLLDDTCAWLDHVGTRKAGQQDLSTEIGVFRKAFNKTLRSGAEARQNARATSPLVETWVKRHLLEQNVTPPEPGRTTAKRHL